MRDNSIDPELDPMLRELNTLAIMDETSEITIESYLGRAYTDHKFLRLRRHREPRPNLVNTQCGFPPASACTDDGKVCGTGYRADECGLGV